VLECFLDDVDAGSPEKMWQNQKPKIKNLALCPIAAPWYTTLA
jgi:hypothetical protein